MILISGGQTGADMGGLEAGAALGLETGGYAPLGWKTEVGPRPGLQKWGLLEWHVPGYAARTEANVLLADATLIFGKRSIGSDLTHTVCLRAKKPCYWVGDIVAFDERALLNARAYVQVLLNLGKPKILNIAGNRESVNPGIQEATRDFLVAVLE